MDWIKNEDKKVVEFHKAHRLAVQLTGPVMERTITLWINGRVERKRRLTDRTDDELVKDGLAWLRETVDIRTAEPAGW